MDAAHGRSFLNLIPPVSRLYVLSPAAVSCILFVSPIWSGRVCLAAATNWAASPGGSKFGRRALLPGVPSGVSAPVPRHAALADRVLALLQ